MEQQMKQQLEPSIVMCRFIEIELVIESANRTWTHTSSAYTLLLVASGGGQLINHIGTTLLDDGRCLLLAPGSSCLLEIGEKGLSGYRIGFELVGRTELDRGVTGLDSLEALMRHSVSPCGSLAACMSLADQLYQHRLERDELEQFENQIRFQKLLLSILREHRAADASGEADIRQAVQRSVDYVKENYAQPLAIEQLAAMTSISRWRYTQLFKEATGRIPIDFLNAVRIDKAQELLLLTRDNLNDIARAVGYSNEYYFNRKFKQKIGMTPGQYRSGYRTNSRIFAPFLEDYLLALGVTPVMQFVHKKWGKQEYLEMPEVPVFDVTSGDWKALSQHKPEVTILDDGYQRWNLERCSQYSPVFKLPFVNEDWRLTLNSLGVVLGRQSQAAQAIVQFEDEIAAARERLARTARQETVAVLRISSQKVVLYGGPARGYTGPLLYQGIGLSEPAFIRQFVQEQRCVALTEEQWSSLDADHLFITFDKGEGEGRELLHTPAWRNLPAVKGNRVYEVDFLAWMNYGVLSHHRKLRDVLRIMG